MEERLAKELLDASNNTGASVKKKKICTRWQKQTKHSHITDSNFKNLFWRLARYASMLKLIGGKNLGWKRISIRENQKYRNHGSY